MGYILQNSGIITFRTIIDSAAVRTMGTSPVYLNGFYPNNINSYCFIPLSATLRIVDQTVPYDFPPGGHTTIQDSGTFFFFWEDLLNDQYPNAYMYTSMYTQGQHNYSGVPWTANFNAQKNNNQFYLTTENGSDCTTGDGKLHITIAGFKTVV